MNSSFSKWIIRTIIFVVVFAAFLFTLVYVYNRLFNVAITQTDLPAVIYPIQTVIGTSVEGRSINSFTYGNGQKHLVFVGGIHGGYEWNSILLSYKFMDYLKANPEIIPKNIMVTVIPSLNPDGVYKVIGKEGRFTALDIPTGDSSLGRFNANKVDLNRNFDCKWQPESTWKGNIVSAGTKAFSEPEAQALKDFILKGKPSAVVFWHSQSNAIYASECKAGILPETIKLMNKYSLVSGYPVSLSFNSYEITGDASDWLASINIPAITVELKTHETIEWDKNLTGIKALFNYFGLEN